MACSSAPIRLAYLLCLWQTPPSDIPSGESASSDPLCPHSHPLRRVWVCSAPKEKIIFQAEVISQPTHYFLSFFYLPYALGLSIIEYRLPSCSFNDMVVLFQLISAHSALENMRST